MPEIKNYSLKIGDQELKVEIGKLASQANGSVTARLGDTVVLATAVMSKTPRIGVDYMPLTVDYEEKYYARGKILGSRFIRREGRPSEEAILNARLIDRAIRPLFDQNIRNEIQIVSTILSVDEKNDPDIIAMIASSIALTISNIPWTGPIAAVRIGRTDSKWILNPSFEERRSGIADLVVSVSPDLKINMIEAGGSEIKEDELLNGFKFAEEALKNIVEFIKNIASDFNTPKTAATLAAADNELEQKVKEFLNKDEILSKAVYEKKKDQRLANIDTVKEELNKYIAEIDEEKLKVADILFEKAIDEMVHKNVLEKEMRPDGRKLDELRDLTSEISFLPRTHGSGLFQRGETQVLSALTLGAPSDEQIIEGMIVQTKKHFMHQYNFPPFSVGETGRMGGPGRREIGHGALAEKALEPLIPKKEEFPYAIRIVSEVLSSNGSSSMASTCASTLALMDGGVPIKKPVAGIAMGLMSDRSGNYKILTDIQGPEDHYGDMDLKVAGTKNGVTALQMDVKIDGITSRIFQETILQAKEARLHILEQMNKIISAPRKEMSKYAPRITSFFINPDKIRDVIGPGGKIINEIIKETEVTIDIEDSGLVMVTSKDAENAKRAIAWINDLVREAKVGETYDGKVTRIIDFGAFVEIFPGTEGLLHISEIAEYRVNAVSDVFKVGDSVKVKVKAIDHLGRVNLTAKNLQK